MWTCLTPRTWHSHFHLSHLQERSFSITQNPFQEMPIFLLQLPIMVISVWNSGVFGHFGCQTDQTTQELPICELISWQWCWWFMFEWQRVFCSSMDGNRCDWQRAPGLIALFTWSVLLPCKVWKWVNIDNVFSFTSKSSVHVTPFCQELSDNFIYLFLRLPTA